jgi:glutathione S-transferase
MKLYAFPPSPNTFKVLAVANHLRLPLTVELVDLTKGEQRAPTYTALCPGSRTPTLVDGEFVLWESNAILQYIASKSKNELWPDDPRTRADIGRWQFWQIAHWHQGCGPYLFENLVKDVMKMGPPDAQALEKAEPVFRKEAALLDGHLARRSWLVGSGPTLADFAVGAYLFYAERARLPLSGYANVHRWFEAVAALPSWKGAAPGV